MAEPIVEIASLNEFEEKIKIQLNEDEEVHSSRFKAFYEWLNKLVASERSSSGKNTLENLNNDQGVRKLMTDFHRLIQAAKPNRRPAIFLDFTKELTSHLNRKGRVMLPESEIKRRKKRIDKIKKMMIKLDNKIKDYSKREVSLEDLENGENGPIEKKRSCEKKVIKLYTELRKLENRHQYYGEDEIDFGDVSENCELNKILADHVLKKFNKKKDEPDFAEINEIVAKFSTEKGILLDSTKIFKSIGQKFKKFRSQSLEFILNAHLDDEEDQETDPYEEDEALRQKLDTQNNFGTQLDDVVAEFKKKAENCNLQDVDEEDEESEDSESDSLCEDENELESISEHEDEFLSPAERNSSDDESADESVDEDDRSEVEDDTSKASSSKSNDEATLKRTLAEAEEPEETATVGMKKVKFDNSDPDLIVLD